MYNQGVIDTDSQKSIYHWIDYYLSIRIKLNMENIIIVSNMLSYE